LASSAAKAWNTLVGTYVNVVPLSITVPYPTSKSPAVAMVSPPISHFSVLTT
jgi:hypothetical protein